MRAYARVEESMSNAPIIITAVAIDIVVSAAVVVWVMRRRGLVGSIGADLDKIRSFSESVREPIANYLRANYSGDVETLPAALEGLLAVLEAEAKKAHLSLSRDALKMILLRVIAAQNEVPAGIAMTALKKVA
jgi:hypothetical protein